MKKLTHTLIEQIIEQNDQWCDLSARLLSLLSDETPKKEISPEELIDKLFDI